MWEMMSSRSSKGRVVRFASTGWEFGHFPVQGVGQVVDCQMWKYRAWTRLGLVRPADSGSGSKVRIKRNIHTK